MENGPFPVVEHMTVKQVRQYLLRKQSIIVPIGVMGFPERASAELGRRVNDGIVQNASRKINELEQQADGVYKEVPFTPEPIIL